MKQIKLLIAVLAVAFSSTSAFTSHGKFTLATYSFIAGSLHPENASSWTLKTQTFYCISTHGYPCLIIANQGIGTKPDQSDVTILSSISENMTIATSYQFLRVKVKLTP